MNTDPTEFQLIINEVEKIDDLINNAQMFVTWNSEGKKLKILVNNRDPSL